MEVITSTSIWASTPDFWSIWTLLDFKNIFSIKNTIKKFTFVNFFISIGITSVHESSILFIIKISDSVLNIDNLITTSIIYIEESFDIFYNMITNIRNIVLISTSFTFNIWVITMKISVTITIIVSV